MGMDVNDASEPHGDGSDPQAAPAAARPGLVPMEGDGAGRSLADADDYGPDQPMPLAQKVTIAAALAGLAVMVAYFASYWL